MVQFDDLVVAPPIEFEHVLVEFEEAASVGDGEEGDLEFFGLEVELCLNIHAHGGGALVQNCE